MNVLILFDSYFGNTEKVAREIAGVFADDNAKAIKVGEFQPDQLKGVDLLIAGAPTRGFRPSEGMGSFLKSLPAGALNGVKVAAFDTRILEKDVKQGFVRFMMRSFGYAAESIAKALVKAGGAQVLPPAGYAVKESEGPLYEGELERAAAWAKAAK